MKTQKNISLQNNALVAIDTKLDKLRDKVTFTEKLDKANKVLLTAKLPSTR
jgi:hypothetical protein